MPKTIESHATTTVARTLDWKGAATNAMALIAPGAFLWITFQLQAAASDPSGASVANDMWAGIVAAVVLALLTALSYSELAKIYPEAGFASCVYFAEKAFIDDSGEKRPGPTSFARVAKLITGWAAHLFYWVYPGVMVAFMAILVGYLFTALTGNTMTMMWQLVVAWGFALIVGFIAYKGVQGSTKMNFWSNIIQWVTLLVFSGLAIWYRLSNPEHATSWAFSGPVDIVSFHAIKGVLVQSTIAILILVGFESSTALSAETKEPEKNIPKAIMVALVVQCVFAYFIEYFAANMMVSEKLAGSVAVPAVQAVAAVAATATSPAVAAVAAAPATTKIVMGMDALVASSAPIGDMARHLGDSLLGGMGTFLMITMATTVAIAIIGTTLACMNTAVRVTFGMAEDRELPQMMGYMHEKNASPHTAIWALVAISCVIATIGIQSVVGLTGITLASNFGTFVLYAAVCVWTYIAYRKRKDYSALKHLVIPALGFVLNLLMCGAIIYLYTIGNADAQNEAKICFYIAGGWAMVSFLYVMLTTVKKNYGMKMISAIIRPESLDPLVDALHGEDLIQGMTVTEVRGFGRQRGGKNHDQQADKIKFLPKTRVDIVVNDWDVPHIMDVMQGILNTGKAGDGKIFVLDARETVRVRTGEAGIKAV